MRYSYVVKQARKRYLANWHSVGLIAILIVLILVLGFTTLDAKEFFSGFGESLLRVVIAYFISLILALSAILVFHWNSKLEELSVPILDVLQSFPSITLFPLLVAWFGKNSIVTIIILVVAMIWPIMFTLIAAQKQIREDLNEAAYAFNARGWKYLWYVFWPLLLPAVITGSIVAWGEAWETIIAAEIIIAIPGVGTYLADAGETNNTPVLIIGIFLLLTILFIINKIIWLSLLNSSTKYQQES